MALLLVADIHQDLEYLNQAVSYFYRSGLDRILFLGDYFWANDELYRETEHVMRFSERISELFETLGEKATFLCGNRDIPYYLSVLSAQPQIMVRHLPSYYQKQFNEEAARIFKELIHPNFWHTLGCAHLELGWLFSHAGLNMNFLPQGPLASAVDALNQHFSEAVQRALTGEFHPILQASEGKHGPLKQGGPLWQLFDDEFSDSLSVPQVVGHTRGKEVRRKGRSYCIDCEQTVVATIDDEQNFLSIEL